MSEDVTDAVLAAFFVGLMTPIALGPALVPSVSANYVEGVFCGAWLVMLAVWALLAWDTATDDVNDGEPEPAPEEERL